LGDTVTESDVMGLIGKTLYFSDTTIHPDLTFDENLTSETWDSDDTTNTSYYMKITNVVFLKNDTTLGTPVRTYVVTGTCSAILSQGSNASIFSGGQFNFIISRMDL
jgi:hypothetical protein